MRVVLKFRKRGDRVDRHQVVTYCNRKFPACRRWCHKVFPIEENEDANGWEKPCWETSSTKSVSSLCGPASCKKTRMIFYPCNRGGCWLGCPCFHCRGCPVESLNAIDLYNNHQQYHHARHLSCSYCNEIFQVIPAYFYDAFIDIYGEFPLRGVVRPMKSIAHKSFVLYHSNFFVKVSNKMELHCDECDQVFTNKKNKYRHMKAVHLKIKPFKCDKCEKSFPYDNMKRHHKEVHDPVPMEIKSSCNQCGKTFSNVDNLLKHKNFNFDDACQKCDTDFCNSTQLNMHNKKERLKCTKCKESFSRKSNMQAHVNRSKSVCSMCSETFCNKRQLILHNSNCMIENKNIQIVAQQHPCDHCEKTFTTESNKSRHMKTSHLCAKVFHCKDCDKGFDRSDILMKHKMEVHPTEPYSNSCNSCRSTFTKFESWLKHVEANLDDDGQPLNKCTECSIDFCNSTQLKQHMNKNHLECSECKQIFSKRANLVTHIKKNKVGCSFCSKTFCNIKQLLLHKKGVHSSQVQYEKSELLFDLGKKLEKHLEKHD